MHVGDKVVCIDKSSVVAFDAVRVDLPLAKQVELLSEANWEASGQGERGGEGGRQDHLHLLLTINSWDTFYGQGATTFPKTSFHAPPQPGVLSGKAAVRVAITTDAQSQDTKTFGLTVCMAVNTGVLPNEGFFTPTCAIHSSS